MAYQSRQCGGPECSTKSLSPYESQRNLPRYGSVQLVGAFTGYFCPGAPECHDDTRQTDCATQLVWRQNRDTTRVCNPLRELGRLPDSSQADSRRSSGRHMAGEKTLYVCFDFSRLVSNELALLVRGYDVTTVLCTDGLIAFSGYADYSRVIVDEGAPGDREFVERWLKDNYPAIPVIVLGDLRLES